MSPGREPAESQPSVARYRLRVAKHGNARYLSHLDTVRAILRTLRRAAVPVALSGGFNPQPKVAYATALAVGVESEAEYIDIELVRQVEPLTIARAIAAELPDGFSLRELRTVPLRRPAIASYNAVSRYEVAPGPTCEASWQVEGATEPVVRLTERAAELLAMSELVVERQHGKHVNIRPNIVSIGVTAGPRVDFELLSEQSGAPRVAEVMSLLGLDPALWQVRKTDFWPLEKGTKVSPWQA